MKKLILKYLLSLVESLLKEEAVKYVASTSNPYDDKFLKFLLDLLDSIKK